VHSLAMTEFNDPVECSSFGVHSKSHAIWVSNRFMITPNGGAYVPIEILPGISAFQIGGLHSGMIDGVHATDLWRVLESSLTRNPELSADVVSAPKTSY
jgi:hypothetical protein